MSFEKFQVLHRILLTEEKCIIFQKPGRRLSQIFAYFAFFVALNLVVVFAVFMCVYFSVVFLQFGMGVSIKWQ